MKKVYFLFTAVSFLFILYCGKIYSYNTDSLDNKDTIKKNLSQLITEIIKSVNEKGAGIDLIHSEGSIQVKTSKIDQKGSIEIKAKKPNDFWFRIWGSFAIVSKDAFIAHFNRKNFIYFDNLNDKVIEGPSTDDNIGYITRVKCSFDDMMNVLTGTVRITYTKKDTISFKEDNNYYQLTFKNVKIRRFWIRKSDYIVERYAYLNRKNFITTQFEFSNFTTNAFGTYSKKIVMTKGTIKVSYKISEVKLNQKNLTFEVDYPSGVRKVRW